MARLIIISGTRAGQEIPIEGERITLGRIAGCDVTIPDPKASRRHARIFLSEGAYSVADLNSRNGTLVNGKRAGRARLHDGDRILIGTTEIEFRDTEPEPALAASTLGSPAPESSRRADPLAGAVPGDIRTAGAPLQFSPFRDDRSRSVLREDLAQSGGGFRLIALVLGIALLLGAALGAAWLTIRAF